MTDSLRVGRVKRVGYLNGEIKQRLSLEWFPLDALFERLPFEQLHSYERLPLILVGVVDRTDVGVIEPRRSLGFAAEAFEGLVFLGQRLRQKLERDEAVQLGVLGFVDHTHAAATQLFENAVVGYGSAGHVRRPATKFRKERP